MMATSGTLRARTTGPAVSLSARRARGPAPCAAAPKLYINPQIANSRGQIVLWYAKELDIEDELEIIEMDFEKLEHKTPEFIGNVNPFGRLPAMKFDDGAIHESGALLCYLMDKYIGFESPEERAGVTHWVMYANATLLPAMAHGNPEVLSGNIQVIENVLSETEYLTGDDFTVADVAVGAYLVYLPMFKPNFDTSPYPKVQKFMHELTSRKSFQEVYGS